MTDTKLTRIAWLSARDPHKRCACWMHHFKEGSLAACFHEREGKQAVGIEGVSKAEYAEHLEANRQDVVVRRKRMTYRPLPVRQVRIPKEGQPGAQRPLGSRVLEDKIVPKRRPKVRESI